MNATWGAFRRLLPVWLPAAVLAIGSIGFYVWQSSGSVGRAAQIEARITELESENARLEAIGRQAGEERDHVDATQEQFRHLYDDVFGSLDQRLVAIMRAVGDAASAAGLRPRGYNYTVSRDKQLDQIRFTIGFAVVGEYPQMRKLLAELQTSREFLIIDDLSFGGEDLTTSRKLNIGVRVSTYLSEADDEQLKQLTGQLGLVEAGGNG